MDLSGCFSAQIVLGPLSDSGAVSWVTSEQSDNRPAASILSTQDFETILKVEKQVWGGKN